MSKPKLRTYQLFKTDFGKECYISQNLNRKLRSMLAQLRFGILPLQIETDRFRNIALQERICRVCDLNQVESEIHFLFICPMYNIIRNQWICKMNITNSDWLRMDNHEKLLHIFKYPKYTAQFIMDSFEQRRSVLFT